MYHSLKSKYSFYILSLAFITSFIFILMTPVFSQLAPVTPPVGGFRIDGNLIAGKLNKGVQYFSTIVPPGTHKLVYILRTGEQKVSGTVIRE